MERLDFASVMAVLRRNISEDRCPNQVELVYTLFRDFCTEQPDMEFDNGQICRWINGLARLSPRITAYYQENRNRRKLTNTIESHILPMMPDSAMAVQELHDLLIQAPNVSSQKKAELTEPADPAVFVTEILCFAMELHFEKRDVRKPALIPAGSRSPAVVDFIFSADVPRPCRWFQGRESELEQLHRLLMTERKVFLHGIPGIGKSELAKVYNAQHGREYTNVLYLNYTGSLIRDIAKLDFADDLPGEAEDIRFLRHDCFLRSLREDTLLIVDNFNAIASQDTYLDAMLQYRCRILFTTRCRFEDQISLELTELPPASLLGLMKYFHPDSGTVEEEIIELLHRHTFAVELAARLLANGILSPEILWQKLWVEKSAMDAEDRISSVKDGKSRRATYYDHIHTLFALSLLSCNQKNLLRSMTLMPVTGVPVRRFAIWMQLRNLNDVNELIEMGFIHPQNQREILLHPIIREVALEELKPSVQNCSALLNSLETLCLAHGMEFMEYRQIFQIVEDIISNITKDDVPRYLLFLEDCFQLMHKYNYSQGMNAIICELSTILSDKTNGTAKDRALLLYCRSACETNPQEAIRLTEQALQVLGPINMDTAPFAANLHNNLGTFYSNERQFELAKQHLEQGLLLMKNHPLSNCHDKIAQVHNYATLLANTGQLQQAHSVFLRLEDFVKTHVGEMSLDYGTIQEALGGISLVLRRPNEAYSHYKKAMAVYNLLLEGEPSLLEQKKREITTLLRLAKGKDTTVLDN